VLQALINALDSGRLHHAYLFTGTRGVGKTTIARILAKALNCDKGVTSEPCGECSACREIDEGRFVDLIEVDAASKTKVDDTRDLLDNVQYAPARGRYKVYLIDEVHMLSKSSFNALLKTLEEPPPHVKFLLATTDPQKLPVTVLSRCLQFNLKRMTPRLMSDRLAYICDAESIEYEPPALALLARAADGSMRDALSLLDQAIAYCGGRIDQAQVALMLGTIDRDHVSRLLRLLADDDGKGIIDAIREIDEQFPDYSRLLEDLARDLQRIAVFQLVGTCDSEDDLSEQQTAELAAALPAADVQLFYQIAVMGRRDLHLAPDPRSGAEMTFLRMLAFRPTSGELAGTSGGGSSTADKPTAAAKPTQARAARRAEPVTAAAQSQTWQDPDWGQLVADLGFGGAVRLLASNCAFLRREENIVYLGLDPRSESLLTKQRKDALAERLSEHFGERLTVDVSVDAAIGAETNETPVQEESRVADERMEAERQKLEADPNVQAMKNIFGAEIKTETIELINPTQSD
jgi:DNA polymerase-3 subunit gamma/tau